MSTVLIALRMVSISFDRPTALSNDAQVPLPAFIDDEYLYATGEGQQPTGVPSRLEFFIYAMTLHDIRTKFQINHSQFSKIGNQYSGQRLGDVLDMISDLDGFLKDLPPHLQNNNSLPITENENGVCF